MEEKGEEAFLAVDQSDIEGIREIKDSGIDITKFKKSNRNLLHYASEIGREKVVEFLLDHGFDIEETTSDLDGYRPLHLATRKGHIKTVEILLSRGASINSKDKYQATALHKACRALYIDIIRLLIDRGVDLNIGDNNEWSSLHRACAAGRHDIVHLLVEKGANIEKLDVNGATCMHVAADAGRKDVVEYLIENNANVCAKDNYGLTPLSRAAKKGNTDVIMILINCDNACLSMVDKLGRTCLHIAAEEGQSSVVQELLDNTNVNLDLVNKKGYTALESAIETGNFESVKLLIGKGASMNCRSGFSPIFLCCKDTGNKVLNDKLVLILDFLLTNGADISVQNSEKLLPLHYAAQNGVLQMVECLVQVGKADVNAVANGKTAVDFALPFKVDIANFLQNPALHDPPMRTSEIEKTETTKDSLKSEQTKFGQSLSRFCTIS